MVSNSYMQMIRAYADSVTVCSPKEQWKCKLGLQTSVPLKRYNCYTEKNIVIVLRLIFLGNVTQIDVPEVIMKRKQQDAWAKHCSTEKRHQKAQAMVAQDVEARRQEDANCQEK